MADEELKLQFCFPFVRKVTLSLGSIMTQDPNSFCQLPSGTPSNYVLYSLENFHLVKQSEKGCPVRDI